MLREWVRDIGVAACAIFITLQFVQTARVEGVSMLPNFRQNDLLFLSTQSYTNKTPRRGQVIVFRSALTASNGKHELLIKRICGLPGDTVTIREGRVYVNGKEQDAGYTRDFRTNGDMTVTVPKDSYFVLGDNRLNSVDSRYQEIGFVRKDDVKGRVVFRVWPLTKFGFVSRGGNTGS